MKSYSLRNGVCTVKFPLSLPQTEDEFLEGLTQGFTDDPGDRDDEDEEDDESEEREVEEEQERETSQNGGRSSQSLRSTVERRPDVGAMVYALQQEGEAKALCAFFSWLDIFHVIMCVKSLFSKPLRLQEYIILLLLLGLVSCCCFFTTGMSEPLLWLQSCLNRTAIDREQDGKCNCPKKKKSYPFCMLFMYSIECCIFYLLYLSIFVADLEVCFAQQN